MKTHGNYVIRFTKDLGKFEVHPENRKVMDIMSKKFLKGIMKLYGFLPVFPIWVYLNGHNKLQVKSGHHRLRCVAELQAEGVDIGVYYIEYPNIGTIYEFEHATTRWSLINFLQSLMYNHPDYELVKRFMEESGIPPSVTVQLLGGIKDFANHSSLLDNFKKGEYEVKKSFLSAGGHATKVKDLVVYLKGIGVRFASNRSMVSALSLIVQVNGFDTEIFKKRAKSNRNMWVKQSTRDQYLNMIEEIYNRLNSNKLSLAFEAKKLGKD